MNKKLKNIAKIYTGNLLENKNKMGKRDICTNASNSGITLIALIITIIVLLLLAGITLNMVIGNNGIFNKANIAKEKSNKADAKESLELLLIEIKTQVVSEEKRDTVIKDLDKLKDKENIEKIEYISEQATTQIIDVENPTAALVTYRKYVFKVDKNLKIIDSKEDDSKENEPEKDNKLEIDDELQKLLTEAGMSISTEDILNTPAIMEKVQGLIPEESESTVKNKTTENGVIQYEDNFGGKIRTNDEADTWFGWKALNTNTSEMAYTNQKPSNFYVEYEFPNEVYALKTKFSITNGSSSAGKRRIVVQGYNESSKKWENITEELVYSGNTSEMSEIRDANLKCEKTYKKFRLQFLSIEDSTGNGALSSGVIMFQLYGTSNVKSSNKEEITIKMLSENNVKISLQDMVTNKEFTKKLLDKLSIETVKNNNTLKENAYELIPEESESTVKNKTTENGVIQYEDIYGGKIRTEQEYENNYYAWNAFSKNSVTCTMSSNASSHYVEYEFPNEVYALKTKFSLTNGSRYSGTRKLAIQGFNENNNEWENISEELSYTGNASALSTEQNIDLISNKSYKKFRLQFLEAGTGRGDTLSGVTIFQLYGKQAN